MEPKNMNGVSLLATIFVLFILFLIIFASVGGF